MNAGSTQANLLRKVSLMKHQSNKQTPTVEPFYHADTGTFSYVVFDPETNRCAIIDSVLDFDYAGGGISFHSADLIVKFIEDQNLLTDYLIETHVHADHLSAAPYLQTRLGGKLMISRQITTVQEVFGKVFNEGTQFKRDGKQFDILLDDGDEYQVGAISACALATPGHTPACMTHVIGDVAFVGDTLFMPDSGTARADFPGGDASELYRSIKRILTLPDETKLYVCHDYNSERDALRCVSRVIEQVSNNIHLSENVIEADFVKARMAKDRTLPAPRLIYPALQVNMRAGQLPEAESNGAVYIKVPVKIRASTELS